MTGDEPQGTMGRVQTACLLPAFLCAHIFIKRETSGYEAAFGLIDQRDRITVGCKPAINFGTFVPTIIPSLARFFEVLFIREESSYLFKLN